MEEEGCSKLLIKKIKIEGCDLVTTMVTKSVSLILESSNLHLLALMSHVHMSFIHLR